MKIFKYLLIATFALFISSCESELDLEPAQSISVDAALSSEDNIFNILIGTYETAGDFRLFGGSAQVIAELLGTSNQVSWNGTFIAPREIIQKNILIDNTFVEDHWNIAYLTINQANLVIDNLEIIENADERDIAQGEAKFLRALTYFDLIRLYALQYQFGAQNTQPGVPLRIEGLIDYSVDLSIPRSTVEEVYTQIISDLIDAQALLPVNNSFFADQFAAKALLARVYFQQGNYAEARDLADDVLSNSGHALAPNFAGAFNNDQDGIEDIFTFQVTSQVGDNDLIRYYASETNGGRGGDISINTAYFDLFDDPENDVRFSFNYVSPTTGGILTSKYTNQFANVPMLRIAEMHLIRAESNFREGTSLGLDPLTEINALRARSNASPLDSLSLDIFFDERQRELAFEGHILFDHKRTDRAIGELPASSDDLVLPIPQSEMDTNSLIVQNPGYSN